MPTDNTMTRRLGRALARADGTALRAAIGLLERLPSAARSLAAPTPTVDGQTLDWRWALILRAQRVALPSLEELPVDASRRLFRRSMAALASAAIGPGPSARVRQGGQTRETTVEGASGPLPARWYLPPDPSDCHGAVIYWHGGGFVLGDLDTHATTCRRLASHGLRVLAATYRRAPEHVFPSAVEDALATARAVLAAETGPVFVAGDSAGASLSAAVCRLLAMAAEPVPAGQVLFYPPTNVPGRYRSDDLFEQHFGLERGLMDWFMDHTFGGPGCGDRTDPRISPLNHPVPAGLPPAYLSLAGFDPLRDQGRLWARAMTDAGTQTQVTLVEHPSQIHGFVNAVGLIEGATAAVDDAARWMTTIARR